MHMDFARFAPNCALSRHLITAIIHVVLCYIRKNIHFGFKLYTQLALVNKIGMLILSLEISWKFIRSP